MTIDRRTFADHYDRVIAVLSVIQHTGAAIILMSFAGYGLAAYLLYTGHVWLALILATFAFGVFRSYAALSLLSAKWLLKSKDGYAATFKILDYEFATRKPEEVLREIQFLVEETSHNQPPRGSN